jgi:hypothetical protein
MNEESVMAHLWRIDDDGAWTPTLLDAESFALQPSAVVMRRSGAERDMTWSLLTPADPPTFVNGAPVLMGITTLADRDEIRVAGARSFFFATETLAGVAPFPAGGPRGFCPRCKQQIEAGAPAVACPRCALWYHQSDTLPCWTYAERCSACAQATALDTGFSWTPEEV